MENTGFNQAQFSKFTPEVTKKHNSNILGALVITVMVIAAGALVYNHVNQKLRDDDRLNSN